MWVPEADAEEIDRKHLDVQESYSIFAAYSESGAVSRDHSGSAEAFQRIRSRSMPKGSLEAPAQKLERLQAEVMELAESVKMSQEQGGMVGAQYPATARAELGDLQAKLNGIARAMSSEAPVLEAMQGCTADKIMQDLGSYTASIPTVQGVSDEAAAVGAGSITYEVFLEPNSGGVALDKVSDLERRLQKLENATGGVALRGELPQDLSTMVRQLSDKVSLLDKGAISKLAAATTDATNKLQATAAKKRELGKDEADQIGVVAEAVQKWSPLAEELPHVVNRLYQLKRVHTQAALYVGSLQSITAEQSAINGGLKTQEDLLKQVQASLQDNIKTMSGNLKALEIRFAELE